MTMKNGAPNHTVTRMTEKRAQPGSPTQPMRSMPRFWRIQLKALKDGSNSNRQASTLMAGGITHDTRSMPRHLRWPFVGMLCRRWASTKPMIARRDVGLHEGMAEDGQPARRRPAHCQPEGGRLRLLA